MIHTLDRDLTLGDLILLLWRRRLLVLALMLVGAAGAAAFTFASPTHYRATAQLVLTGVLYVNSAESPLGSDPVPTFVVRPAPLDRAAMAAIATGPAVMRPVRRDAADYRFDVETAGDQLIKLSVLGPNPATAAALAHKWALALRDVLVGLYRPDTDPAIAARADAPTYQLYWPIHILADPDASGAPVRRSLKRDALLGLIAGAALGVFLALSFAPRPRPRPRN